MPMLVLNCKRLSYFRSFSHGIITNHRNVMCLYRDYSASTSIRKGEREDKESNRKWHRKESVQLKNWCPSYKFFYVLFSVTQSFLLGFSWSSDNIPVRAIRRTSKNEPTCISEITISYLHKNIVIPLLCQCRCLYIDVCLKIQLCLKMWFSTSFDTTWYGEAAIYTKNLLFSLSIVS